MTTQHTPGPWEYDGEYVEALEGDEPISICTLAEVHVSDEGGWQRMANARLITAAPDLLEALEAVGEWCDLIEQNYPEMLFPKKVRAAIARARGG